MTSTGYSYAVVRYVHDAVANESLNVGVVLHDELGNFAFRSTPSYSRLRAAFPDANISGIERLIKSVETLFSIHFARSTSTTLRDAVGIVVPKTEGSIKCEVRGGGITNDIHATADLLLDRLVLRCNEIFRHEIVTNTVNRTEYTSIAFNSGERGLIAANEPNIYENAHIEPMTATAR